MLLRRILTKTGSYSGDFCSFILNNDRIREGFADLVLHRHQPALIKSKLDAEWIRLIMSRGRLIRRSNNWRRSGTSRTITTEMLCTERRSDSLLPDIYVIINPRKCHDFRCEVLRKSRLSVANVGRVQKKAVMPSWSSSFFISHKDPHTIGVKFSSS